MKAKALEIRDRATFLPALAVDMNPLTVGEHYLLRRVGYPCDGSPNILLTRLSGEGQATNDPFVWGDRTFQVAHEYILKNWDGLVNGDVVDVEFILGETTQPKLSEKENQSER
jgi:hypothetical protein